MELLTPRGVGGIAVVRCVAPRERATLLASLWRRDGRPAWPVAGGPPLHCVLRVDGEDLDEVIAVDLGVALEVHLHGSPAVLDAVQARFGPFAETTQEPAARLLQQALHPAQLALALEQQEPGFAAFLRRLDGLPGPARRREAAEALARSRVALAMVEPCRLVLIGAQNAGKSSLLNRILSRERALTGPLPGLTRDPVRERVALSGYPYEVVDTAGEGPASAAADRQAQQLARGERSGALLVLVVDGSIGPSPADRELAQAAMLVVRTKADLPQAPWPAGFPCDLAVGPAGGADPTAARLGELLRVRRSLPPAGPVGGPAALDGAQQEALAARC
jgi:small GTP-binding protein